MTSDYGGDPRWVVNLDLGTILECLELIPDVKKMRTCF